MEDKHRYYFVSSRKYDYEYSVINRDKTITKKFEYNHRRLCRPNLG